MPAAATGVTPQSFAQSLLSSLGAPATPANIQSIVAWEAMEGGNWHNSAKYNPLNTTLTMPGAGSVNSVGVKSYTSWQQGLQATVQTLHSGLYGSIVTALKSGKGLTGNIPGLATWSGGGYSSINPSLAAGYGGGSGAQVSTGAGGGTGVSGSDWTHLLLDIGLLGLGVALLVKGGKQTLSNRSAA